MQELAEEILGQIDDSLPTCIDMGRHAVVIMDASELFERVWKAAEQHGYSLSGNPVEYYDTYPQDALPKDDPGIGIGWRHAFLKSRRYEKQREYRFAFDTHSRGDEPLQLRVGSLRDISRYLKTRDLGDRRKWTIVPG